MQDKQLSSTGLAIVRGAATRFGERLKSCGGDVAETDSCAYLAGLLTASPDKLAGLAEPIAAPPEVPPGAPIGSDEDDWLSLAHLEKP
jgi:hypothetical protein